MEQLLTKQQQRYSDHIKNHQLKVQYAFYNIINHADFYNQIPTDIDLYDLEHRILKHDQSKFSKEEFIQYSQYYYPDNNYVSTELLNQGWVHHYSNNDHHPEYWIVDRDLHMKEILNEDWSELTANDMSIEAILEMFCDWLAMSLQNHSALKQWYNKSGYLLPFSHNTRKLVELILNILYQDKNLDTILMLKI